MGCLPSPTPGSRFLDPNDLGDHSYSLSLFEKDGIVFTTKTGHIDITHIRWTADYTKYLCEMTKQILMQKADGFSFVFVPEVSQHHVTFRYPANWDSFPESDKERIAERIAVAAGEHLAFNASTWHEIITWMKLSIGGLEFNSAFSWEDVYSNLLGTKLAVEALANKQLDYDMAMTQLLDDKLKELDVQPKDVAIQAAEKMRGKWFDGYIVASIIKKNLDIGLDDGFVSPLIVPGFCDTAINLDLPVPDISILQRQGFEMTYQIEPLEWGKERLLKIVYPDDDGEHRAIEPKIHYPVLIDYIKKQAVEQYGCDIK